MPPGIYKRADPVTRFWRRVDQNGPTHPTLGPCWQWCGRPHRSGYGRHTTADGVVYVHRFAYELLVSLIPDGLQIDHLCRNTMCVRPEHLEAVVQRTNLHRGVGPVAANSRKTDCLRGHPLSGPNLALWMNHTTGRWARRCRTCHNERRRKRGGHDRPDHFASKDA